MEKQNTEPEHASSVTWENLETWVRGHVQGFIQQVLEQEVGEFLGRQKSQRRRPLEASGYRNGYGKPRRVTLSCGTITVQRPRVRDCEARFISQVLPLFKRKSTTIETLVPELYLHGLALGDFELALRGLLGDGAPLSGSTVARLKEKWQGELAIWQGRRLDEVEAVYLWIDGIYVKAGLEKEKAALLVVLAALSDGRKVLVAVTPGYRESTESWGTVLRDLRDRGLRPPRLVVGAVGTIRSPMCSISCRSGNRRPAQGSSVRSRRLRRVGKPNGAAISLSLGVRNTAMPMQRSA
jgi:transposase-like protein